MEPAFHLDAKTKGPEPETQLDQAIFPERSKAEVEEMRRRIAVVARVFSNAHDLMLLPAPNGGWAVSIGPEVHQVINEYMSGQRKTLDDVPDHMFRSRIMYYDEQHLKNEEEEAIFGFVRHEIGHIHHSDFRLLMEGQKKAMDDGNLPTTYQHLFNALEDVWINLREGNESPIAKRQIEYCHRKCMPKVVEAIPKMPLNVQLGMNIIHYWLEGKDIPTITDKRVLDTFKEIEPYANEFFWGASAKSNSVLLWEKIWPAARLLEERSVFDQMMKAAAMKLSGKSRGNSQGKGQQGQGKGGAQGQQSQGGGGSQEGGRQPQQGPGGGASGQSQAGGPQQQGGGQKGGQQSGQQGGGQQGGQQQSGQQGGGQQGGQQKSGQQGGGQQGDQQKSGQQGGGQQGGGQQGGGQQGGAFKRFMESAKRAMGMGDKKDKEQEKAERAEQEFEKQLQENAPRELQERLKREMEHDPDGAGGLSEKTKEDLKKYVESLPQDVKQKLQERAKEEIDRQQAEALDDKLPAGMEVKEGKDGKPRTVSFKETPTKKDQAKAQKELDKMLEQADREHQEGKPEQQQGEGDSAAEQARAEAERNSAKSALEKKLKEMEQQGFKSHEMKLFDEFRQLERHTKQTTDRLGKKLEAVIPRHMERVFEGEKYSGQKLNRDALARRIPVNDPRIYHDSEWVETERAKLHLALLFDNSGSMQGERIEAALKTAVALGRLAKRFDMPYAIKVFADDHASLLDFKDDYDDKKNRVKPRLLYSTKELGGSTNMGDPLIELHKELKTARKKFPESAGLIFVVSDSGANTGPVGEHLKKIIMDMQNEFVVVNFILSTSSWEVQTARYYFGDENVVATEDFESLPEEAGKILCKIFERYMKRFSGE